MSAMLMLAHLFVKESRLGDSKVTFLVFESLYEPQASTCYYLPI